MKIRTALIVAALCAMGGGCSGSRVGSTWDKTVDRTQSVNASPNRVSLMVNGESWDSESVVPGAYVRLYDESGVSAESLGPKSRVFQIPWLGGQQAKVASDEDTTFEVAEIRMADGTVIKGLKLSTLASPVVRAQNEVWNRLAVVIQTRDAESAKTLLADAEAVKTITGTLGPGIIELIRSIAGQ